jgi:gliding motility-associated-like protein
MPTMPRLFSFSFVKKIAVYSSFLLCLLFLPTISKATHALGSDMRIEKLDSVTYKVILDVYRDCNGINLPNSQTIRVVNNLSTSSVTATRVARIDITTNCPTVQSSCNGGTGSLGIERHTYEATVTQPAAITSLKFTWRLCCRNNSVTTLISGNSDAMYNEVVIEQPALFNSSPSFIFDPQPIVNRNENINLNFTSKDKEGDSLVYSLVDALENTGDKVEYRPTVTGLQPLEGVVVNLDSKDGLLSFNSPNTQTGVIALKVEEFRNDTLISSLIRDINIAIINSTSPVPNVSPLIGGSGILSPDTIIQSNEKFEARILISSSNLSGTGTTDVLIVDSIPGMSYNLVKKNNDTTFLEINWTPKKSDFGENFFGLSGIYKSCPYNNYSNQNYRIQVDTFPLPVPNPIIVNAKCNNSGDGKAFHNASNLVPGYSVKWYDVNNNLISSNDTLTNRDPGTYYLALRLSPTRAVVRDTVVIGNDQFGGLSAGFSVTPNFGCSAPLNVSFSDTSNVPDTWLWNFGDGSNSLLQNPTHLYSNPGIYQVSLTVQDTITGCNSIAKDTIFISQLTPDFSASSVSGCAPLNVSFQNLTTSIGSKGDSYYWDFGDGGISTAENPTRMYTTPGTYSVSLVVSNMNGCVDSIVKTNYIQVNGPTVDFSSDTTLGTTPLTIQFTDLSSSSVPLSSWAWNFDDGNSSTAQNPSHVFNSTRQYDISLSVTDSNNCSATITKPNFITSGLVSSIQISQPISCNGLSDASLSAINTGGNAPFSYNWSTGETTKNIINKPSGTYYVTVTDNNSNTSVDSINLLDPLALSGSIVSKVDVSCHRDSSGSAIVRGLNGQFGYNYIWSNGQTDSVARNLTAGTYSVTINDSNNCGPISTSVTINEPSPLLGDSIITDVLCHHDATGSAKVLISGGTAPYSYQWASGETADSIVNKTANIYVVTVTDANNCPSFLYPVEISEPPHFHMRIDTSVSSQISCYGFNDGIAVAHGHGGTKPYSFLWSNGLTTDTIKNLSPGTYTASITDANGCGPISKSFTIVEPDSLSTTINSTGNINCFGDSISSIEAIVAGGTSPYNYSWSNNSLTAIITNPKADNYLVTITDQNNCFTTDSILLTQPDSLIASMSTTPVVCTNDGTATASVTGGTTPYNFLWSNGQTSNPAINLGDGGYSVTITDANGCSITDSVTVNRSAAAPTLSATPNHNNCSPAVSTGSALISLSGGTAPFRYAINGGPLSPNTSNSFFSFNNLSASIHVAQVFDANGCTDTVSFTIINKTDTISPTAIAQNITIYLDGSGLATITAADIDNGSSDNCGIASMILDSTAFDCSEVGANSVVLTVTDINANVSTATATVTVVDSVAPTAIAQNITVYLDAAGLGTISAADIDNGSSDNCGITSLAIDSTAFDCSEVGANSVVLTVSDINANVSTATATVTVVDSVAPTAIAQNITVYLDGSGLATITAADIDNGSSDNCGIASLMLDSTAFDCSEVGANSVTLTVTDNNANVSTATATVTVVDSVAPTAIAQNITVYLDATGLATITAADIDNGSSDNCGIANLMIDSTVFDCTEVGANLVVLTVTDNNANVSTATATVTVVDSVAPTAIAQNITVYLDATGLATITAADIDNGSSDNCGIASVALDSTAFDCTEVGANSVVLTVTDNNANISTTTATVTVVDTIIPTAIAQNITVYLDGSGLATITAADIDNGSSDNCGIASMILDSTAFDCSEVGANSVVLTVTDNNANVSTATAIVTVVDSISPVIAGTPNAITVSSDLGNCSAVVSWVLPVASDNCAVDSLVSNFNPNDTFPVGLTTVRYIAYDRSLNTDTIEFSITVIDNEAPTIACPADFSTCDQLVTYSVPTATDNCSIATITQIAGLPSGAIFPFGSTINTFVAEDLSGNKDTCSFTVTIYDNPSIAYAGRDTSICATSFVLSADSISVGNGMWSSPNGGLLFTSPNNPNTAVSNLIIGENLLIWTVSNGVCAPSKDTIIVNRDERPSIADAGSDLILCEQTTVNLDGNSPSVGNGIWKRLSSEGVFTDDTDPNTLVDSLSFGFNKFSWTITNGSCPSNTDTVMVKVSRNPQANAGEDVFIYKDDGIRLNVTADSTNVSYLWSPSFSIEGSNAVQSPFARPESSTEYTVVVTTVDGCFDTDRVNVEVSELLKIPTAFTPDGNGKNDFWDIKNTEEFQSVEVHVYNAFGNEVFYTKNYTEENQWGGKRDNNTLPVGSYYYVIKLIRNNGEAFTETGAVSILR